jgi:hypothetical protein
MAHWNGPILTIGLNSLSGGFRLSRCLATRAYSYQTGPILHTFISESKACAGTTRHFVESKAVLGVENPVQVTATIAFRKNSIFPVPLIKAFNEAQRLNGLRVLNDFSLDNGSVQGEDARLG